MRFLDDVDQLIQSEGFTILDSYLSPPPPKSSGKSMYYIILASIKTDGKQSVRAEVICELRVSDHYVKDLRTIKDPEIRQQKLQERDARRDRYRNDPNVKKINVENNYTGTVGWEAGQVVINNAHYTTWDHLYNQTRLRLKRFKKDVLAYVRNH